LGFLVWKYTIWQPCLPHKKVSLEIVVALESMVITWVYKPWVRIKTRMENNVKQNWIAVKYLFQNFQYSTFTHIN
jgi:hypothetical protein